MPRATHSFFLSLEPMGHLPQLEKARGTIRFDLRHEKTTDSWLLTFDDGRMRVSRNTRKPADTVIRTDIDSFDRVARGEMNFYSLILRGSMLLEGRRPLALMLSRILPDPPETRGPHLRRKDQS
ncbi:MAG TPA: SCP2 sterol-binding domain-containing protein [Jiangellales bacterium]|nr:SCP2 sterol-binding domain-containing protein [Jiangellales bacterium]